MKGSAMLRYVLFPSTASPVPLLSQHIALWLPDIFLTPQHVETPSGFDRLLYHCIHSLDNVTFHADKLHYLELLQPFIDAVPNKHDPNICQTNTNNAKHVDNMIEEQNQQVVSLP